MCPDDTEKRSADLYSQDVTEIIGTGKVDLGFKAMIHTLAVCLGLKRHGFTC